MAEDPCASRARVRVFMLFGSSVDATVPEEGLPGRRDRAMEPRDGEAEDPRALAALHAGPQAARGPRRPGRGLSWLRLRLGQRPLRSPLGHQCMHAELSRALLVGSWRGAQGPCRTVGWMDYSRTEILIYHTQEFLSFELFAIGVLIINAEHLGAKELSQRRLRRSCGCGDSHYW